MRGGAASPADVEDHERVPVVHQPSKMMVTVFGAAGGIGRQVVAKARAAGHNVRAFAREPGRLSDEGIETVAGDIADVDAVRRAIAGVDAVIWAVGATRNAADEPPVFESGARNVVAAMREHGVRRLVALSGAAITVSGERKPIGGRLMSAIVKIAARYVYESKRREHQVFVESGLDWTLVRPPRVIEGRATGRAYLGDELHGSSVTQGDVAEVMVGALFNETYVTAAPFVSSHRGAQRDTA